MTVYETDIPGVGRKFQLDLGDGGSLVVVVHHDGRRDVFHRPSPESDSSKLFSLDDQRARQLGAILEGAYFQPVEVASLDVPLGGAIIEWITISGSSPIAGQALQEAAIRKRTGVSVIAVQRGEQTIANPGPEFEIATSDILVTLGTREELAALDRLLSGESD